MLKWYERQSWCEFKDHLDTHRNEYLPDEKRQLCMAGDIDTMKRLIDLVLKYSEE
jgi:hypothetical protein